MKVYCLSKNNHDFEKRMSGHNFKIDDISLNCDFKEELL